MRGLCAADSRVGAARVSLVLNIAVAEIVTGQEHVHVYMSNCLSATLYLTQTTQKTLINYANIEASLITQQVARPG